MSPQYSLPHSEHHNLSLNHPKHYPDRKLKSLSKQEGRRQEGRRWGEGSQPELHTIDGILKRNLQHISKFSLSK